MVWLDGVVNMDVPDPNQRYRSIPLMYSCVVEWSSSSLSSSSRIYTKLHGSLKILSYKMRKKKMMKKKKKKMQRKNKVCV